MKDESNWNEIELGDIVPSFTGEQSIAKPLPPVTVSFAHVPTRFGLRRLICLHKNTRNSREDEARITAGDMFAVHCWFSH